MDQNIEKVPIHLKMILTIREAVEYSNIGINKIDSMLRMPNCPFVLFVGSKKLVKRKEFEDYIGQKLIIITMPGRHPAQIGMKKSCRKTCLFQNLCYT